MKITKEDFKNCNEFCEPSGCAQFGKPGFKNCLADLKVRLEANIEMEAGSKIPAQVQIKELWVAVIKSKQSIANLLTLLEPFKNQIPWGDSLTWEEFKGKHEVGKPLVILT
jgi:hypothetical protein